MVREVRGNKQDNTLGLVTKTKALDRSNRLFGDAKRGLHVHNYNYKLHPVHLSHTIIATFLFPTEKNVARNYLVCRLGDHYENKSLG